MKKGGTCNKRRGFTLLELLVVIAIIAILIAILLPGLTRVRQKSIDLQCQMNLKQLGLAMTMYTQQYGVFPIQEFGINDTIGSWGAVWPTQLRKFLGGNQKVFYCPAQNPKCEWKSDAPGPVVYAEAIHTQFGYQIGERLLLNGSPWYQPGTRGMFFSYGCNVFGITAANISSHAPTGRAMGIFYFIPPSGWSGAWRCRQVTSVKSPSEFIIMADTAVDGVYDFTISITDDGQNTRWGQTTVPANVHRGGANVLFCDGHVQWYLQKDLVCKDPPLLEERAKQRMWNADNLSAWGT